MWKWMCLFLRKNHLLRCWVQPFLLNWIGCFHITTSISKTASKKIGAFVLWSLFLLRLLCISINLPYAYRYYFGSYSSEMAELVPLLFSWGRSTRYSDRLHDFSVTIPRCYKDVYVNSFLPRTARLWNSLPIVCFPLTYDLSGSKSRINRHLLTVGSFLTDFLCALIVLSFFFL